RSDSTIPLCRRKNEIVIIEGIHALNDMVTASAGEHGFKLYISARSNFMENDELVFKGTWTRLVRRLVRDDRFRSTKAAFTLSIWDSIRVGEKKFISPFRDRADIIINSTHDYEINMLKKHLTSLFAEIPKDILRYDEIMCIPRALERFADIDDELVPKDSLLREFIGGGSFHY
ncbi:MAG: nucleoside kinase, partial [Clostridia bacterium]